MTNLSTSLFGKKLNNPLMLGSGTLVETYEDILRFRTSEIGAIIPRTTRKIMARPTHPIPHLYQAGTRRFPIMLNAEWTGADIEYWQPYLEQMVQMKNVVMSISGRDIDDCVEVCKKLDRYSGWIFYEINLSCAHSNNVHGMITRNRQHIEELIKKIKDAGVSTPIVIKLGHSDLILELACIAEQAGADGIVAINTYGPVFDFSIDESGNPRKVVGIDAAKGGLSGAPIFHIALTDIAEIKRCTKLTVIGCGGVSSPENLVKMLMAGANAVQVYTAAHGYGIDAPKYFSEFTARLEKFCQKHQINNISTIIGKALPLLDFKTTLEDQVPLVNEDICIGCDLCIPVCLPKSITIKEYELSQQKQNKHVVAIDGDSCVGCGHCISVCPTHPKALNFSKLLESTAKTN